jgi:thiosulfate reductase cytochrome b subunit
MSTNVFDAPAAVGGETATEAGAGQVVRSPRHLAAVRIAHWVMAAGVLGLVVSGGGIIISHPRLYWGETGAVGTASLIDLPLPFIIGPSVWNRPIHFFFAWMLVLGGVGYVAAGLLTRHFRNDLLPAKAELTRSRIMDVLAHHLRWKRVSEDEAWTYNVVQRLTYLGVVFVLFPAILWTGLAMSPALMSVFPAMVTVLGGHQSARTLHFFFASLLLLFVLVHMAMLFLVGFTSHVRAMITGTIPKQRTAR